MERAARLHLLRAAGLGARLAAAALLAHGYDVIPSETNFFMVGIGRDVQPVIGEFREKGILVGRPFPSL